MAASKSIGWIDRSRAWFLALAGWRRVLALVLLGAAATMALPPFHLLPLLFVAFVPLFWMIEGSARLRGAFWTGFWFALGHFTLGLYWIAHSMLLDPLRFGWMIPFAVCGLAALLGLFVGAAALAARAWPFPDTSRAIVFACAWVVAEWLRSWVMSGFPWNLIGYSWAVFDPMMQPASLVGAYGVGFLTVLAASMPATLAGPRGRIVPTVAALLVMGIAAAYGIVRLSEATVETVPDVQLRIVQPNIPQSLKNDAELRQMHFERHVRMTLETPGYDAVTHVLWPESSIPWLVERHPEVAAYLTRVVPEDGLLLAGATRAEPLEGDIERIFNGLTVLDKAGVRLATSDKFHLVPFGEYVPLRGLFPFIAKLTPGNLDFTPGPGPVTLRVPGLPPLSALICYEVIFAGDVVDPANRPGWLLNITNDGWFGISTGPHQHFAAARYRAVEEGLPLIRAANTGISGVIDGWGRIVERTHLGEPAVLDTGLPVALSPTLYARWGNFSVAILLGMAMAVAWAIGRRFR